MQLLDDEAVQAERQGMLMSNMRTLIAEQSNYDALIKVRTLITSKLQSKKLVN